MQTWPALVSSGLSQAMSLEKPSIVRLFDDLAEKIHRQYETIGLDFTVSKLYLFSRILVEILALIFYVFFLFSIIFLLVIIIFKRHLLSLSF